MYVRSVAQKRSSITRKVWKRKNLGQNQNLQLKKKLRKNPHRGRHRKRENRRRKIKSQSERKDHLALGK